MNKLSKTECVKPRFSAAPHMTELVEEEIELMQEFAIEVIRSTGSFVLAEKAAELLGVTMETLDFWHAHHRGPKPRGMFGRVFYNTDEIWFFKTNEIHFPERGDFS